MKPCGERFICGFEGTTVSASVEEMIVGWRVGGVVLFSRNVRDARQLAALCGELQSIRRKVSKFPLIIAVDQEGGGVNRIVDGVTHFPSPMAVAAAGDVELADRIGYAMGCQLMRLGINMNFAPVIDVNAGKRNPIIGVRSFGDDPERVAAFGAATIGGMERAGIASVAKHFPGIGSAECDPHAEALVITRSAEHLASGDLVPFKRALEAGVSGIMISHAKYQAVSESPASLSKTVIQGLLRRELCFEGLAITDDLEMGAVSADRSGWRVAEMALAAGVDLLLVCHSRTAQLSALAEATTALRNHRVPPEIVKEGARRIRLFKQKLRSRLSEAQAKTPDEGESLAREVAERAITRVSDVKKIIPLRLRPKEKLLVVSPALGPLTAAEEGAATGNKLADFIRMFHSKTESVSFEIVPSRDDFGRVLKALDGVSIVVMGTCNAHLYGGQARLVREVADVGKPTVFIALRNPYDVRLYPSRTARLAAYGSDNHTLAALARAIFGELAPRGKLPVRMRFRYIH
jgi:beta-N-acetylhexosaminidase